MTRARILELGASPANEPCAQLGRTPDFEHLNKLELLAFQAAIIACNGVPPEGLEFASLANGHDFGTYWTLWVVARGPNTPSANARCWLDNLNIPASWIAAGFPAPVTYDGARPLTIRPILDVIAGALQITRPNPDGSFFPPENVDLHRNLTAAYGTSLARIGNEAPAMPAE